MEGFTLGHPFTKIDRDDVMKAAKRFGLKSDYRSGGGPVATTTQSSTGKVIYVGSQWTSFCCRWQSNKKAPPKDRIQVNGKKVRIVGIDSKKGTLQVDQSVTVPKGAGIDIVYPSGRTSRQRGAHEYWTGISKATFQLIEGLLGPS